MRKLVLGFSVFLGIGIVGIFDYVHKIPARSAKPGEIEMFYGQITKTDGQHKHDIDIYERSGNNPSQKLFSLKGVEYSGSVNISPKRTSLIVNDGNELKIFSLADKKWEDLKQSGTGLFSPDEKTFLIWSYNRDLKTYDVKIFETNKWKLVSEKTGKISDNLATVLMPLVLRADEILFFDEPLGEYSKTWYYDIEKNILKPTNEDYFYNYSNTGKFWSTISSYTPDVCNAFSGEQVESIQLADPVTGEKFAKLVSPGQHLEIEAFSTDDSEVMYKTHKIYHPSKVNNDELFDDCDQDHGQEYAPKYFTADTKSGKTKPVENKDEILKQWKAKLNAWSVDDGKGRYSIQIDSKNVIESDKSLVLYEAFIN